MSDANNISPFGPDRQHRQPLSDERLMAYFEGKLTPEEQHEVELWLAEEGMEGDALEGLHELRPNETRQSVNRLNHELRKAIIQKKKRRKPLQTDIYTWTAIAIILILAIVAYIVFKKAL